MKCFTMNTVKPKVLAHGIYAIDVEPIPSHNRNNREVYLYYLKHLKESVETLWEIVKDARIETPLDNALANACFYAKQSQELLENKIGTCPKEFNNRDKKKVQKTNVPVIPSTGAIRFTKASGSNPKSNTKKNRILLAKSDNKKNVEAHLRNNKSNLKQENHSTGNKFTLEEQFPLTRFTHSKVVPLQQPKHVSTSEIVITERLSNTTQKSLTRYKRRSKKDKTISTGIPTTSASQTIDVPVKYTTISAKQQDPNRN
nr:hypothetical protein [Tanacetum cinerariifolium]